MRENPFATIKKLEKLAAWHRINAEYAGADWVWEARLRTAEDLERRVAEIRAQLPDDRRRRRMTAKKYTRSDRETACRPAAETPSATLA
jgi:hypothetical protein